MQALAAEQLEGRYRPAVDQGRGLDRHLAAKRYRRQLACRKFRKTALGPGPRTSYKMPSHPPEGSKVRKVTAVGKLRRPARADGQRWIADKHKGFIGLRRIVYLKWCSRSISAQGLAGQSNLSFRVRLVLTVLPCPRTATALSTGRGRNRQGEP